jgi:hypothetical protein
VTPTEAELREALRKAKADGYRTQAELYRAYHELVRSHRALFDRGFKP